MSNGTFMLPKERIAKATVEALVINGESNPLAKPGCRSSGPRAAQRYTIAGQPHNVADEAMAPALVEFFLA